MYTIGYSQIYQTTMTLSSMGFEFQPSDSVLDQLDMFNAKSFMQCYYQCHAQLVAAPGVGWGGLSPPERKLSPP